MKSILFLDFVCPAPYNFETAQQGIGGSEATVVRIAEKLSEHFKVFVGQHNRKEISETTRVRYTPCFHEYLESQWHSIIFVRDPLKAVELRPQFKSSLNTPMWVWLHDFARPSYICTLGQMSDHNIGFIVISEFQKNLVLDVYKIDPYIPKVPQIRKIYNPIPDELVPDDTPVDLNKLIYTSGPQKGLNKTLEMFNVLHQKHPQFQLYLAHPNYSTIKWKQYPGTIYLGTLSPAEVIQHMRSSLCQFCMNTVWPETFGLVLAEGNAVGTPMLTHHFGAAPEVLLNHEQLVNVHDSNAVFDKVLSWHNGKRPLVNTSDNFRISNVIKEWHKILE